MANKVTLSNEDCKLVQWRNIQVDTYIPSNFYVHVMSEKEAEDVERVAEQRNVFRDFLIKLMTKKLGYDTLQKGDLVCFAIDDDNNAPKTIGTFSEWDIDGWCENGAPLFRLHLYNAWSVGAREWSRKGDKPLLNNGATSYRFIPKMSWYSEHEGKIMTRHYIRKATDEEKKSYIEAFNEKFDI